MRKFKIKPFEVKKGLWKYQQEELTQIDVKKGDKLFIGSEEIYGELESVKIGANIYDIEKVEEDKVYLTEEIADDFTGKAIYEWTLPVVIRESTQLLLMESENEKYFIKTKGVSKPLSSFSKEFRVDYLRRASEEKGKVDINASDITIITYDQIKDAESQGYNNLIKFLMKKLTFYIDMDYTDESGKDLWTHLGIKKGNFVALTEYLIDPSVGILSNDERQLQLEATIKGVKEKAEDLDTFVKAEIEQAKLFKSLGEVREMYGDDEEGYKKFIDGMIEGLKKNEGTELQHTDN